MKLTKRIDWALIIFIVTSFVFLFGAIYSFSSRATFAEGDGVASSEVFSAKYVNIYDNGKKLTVKTDALTVGEALKRAEIKLNDGDIVDPGLDTEINADNFFINIYRARPVIIRDGIVDKYLMTASYDAKTVASQAGITIYDGDEIALTSNTEFLEGGIANVYKITRNGGRTITEEVEIPFPEETVSDPELEIGKTEVKQLGEVGLKKVYYNVLYVSNEEVSREQISEEVVREPVARITARGAKVDTSNVVVSGTCADWVRAAGVAEADVAAALDLIHHESGCRPNARNAHSGAYGIPQALPGNKMASAGADWETNPVTQIRWMAGYVGRYGGWQGALNFWYAHGWY